MMVKVNNKINWHLLKDAYLNGQKNCFVYIIENELLSRLMMFNGGQKLNNS